MTSSCDEKLSRASAAKIRYSSLRGTSLLVLYDACAAQLRREITRTRAHRVYTLENLLCVLYIYSNTRDRVRIYAEYVCDVCIKNW